MCICLLAVQRLAIAGRFGHTLDIGQPAPAWKNLPGVDGKKHSLSDLKDAEVIVVVFTCNSCPYATDYEDRIIALSKKFDGSTKSDTDAKRGGQAKRKVELVAINVNKVEEDQLPAMKKRAETKKFPFHYLFDETQQIAKDYGAIWTPEFFVLNKKREIVYIGALDDSTDPKKVSKRYVEDAVAATIEGTTLEDAETPAIGCQIRWERRRRSRKKRK